MSTRGHTLMVPDELWEWAHWACGERYKHYWWPTLGGPHLEGGAVG